MHKTLLQQLDDLEMTLAEKEWDLKRQMFLTWLVQQPNRPWN